MSTHLVQAIFPASTGIPADEMINTWYMDGGGGDPVNAVDMIDDFYIAIPQGATAAVSSFMTTESLGGTIRYKVYDLADPKPRVPVFEVERTMPLIGTADALPSEVALCMSYQANTISGVSQARRRGRVYVGGFGTNANDNGRPGQDLIDTMAESARDLLRASNASVSWSWFQYSQVNASGTAVQRGWVDNAFDTQRRRGLDSTSRVLWDLTQP